MKEYLKKIYSFSFTKEELITSIKKKCRKMIAKLILLLIGAITGFGISEIDLVPTKNKDPCSIISTYPAIQTIYPISRTAYTLIYNGATRTPYWVYECVCKKDLEKNCKRKDVNFQEDPALPEIVRSTLQDYRKSGFDRGHLSPSADRTYDCGVLQEVFYLSNMSPQIHSFNSGHWEKLESYVRGLTNQYDKVHVFTIPLYLPHQEGDKKYVHYEVIGENNVAVPTHFAKAIFAGDNIFAFMLPHEDIDSKIPLDDFTVTLEKIERVSGFIFSRKYLAKDNFKKKIIAKSSIPLKWVKKVIKKYNEE